MDILLKMENALFDFARYVKLFHGYLTEKYQLNSHPFDVKGRAFAKSGTEIIDNLPVEYKFHGGGCTLNWGGREIMYNVDVTSVNDIVISSYELVRFIQTDPEYSIPYSFNDARLVLESLEEKGVLMKRKPSDLGSFHIKSDWYEAYKKREDFNGGT
jgi:hypothetical protein